MERARLLRPRAQPPPRRARRRAGGRVPDDARGLARAPRGRPVHGRGRRIDRVRRQRARRGRERRPRLLPPPRPRARPEGSRDADASPGSRAAPRPGAETRAITTRRSWSSARSSARPARRAAARVPSGRSAAPRRAGRRRRSRASRGAPRRARSISSGRSSKEAGGKKGRFFWWKTGRSFRGTSSFPCFARAPGSALKIFLEGGGSASQAGRPLRSRRCGTLRHSVLERRYRIALFTFKENLPSPPPFLPDSVPVFLSLSSDCPPCPWRAAPEGARRVARASHASRRARRRLTRRISSRAHGPLRVPAARRARSGARERARAGGDPPRSRPPLRRLLHGLERGAARVEAPGAGARLERRPFRPRGGRGLGIRACRNAQRPGTPRALRCRGRARPLGLFGGRERPHVGPARRGRDPLAGRARGGGGLASGLARRRGRGLSRRPRGRALGPSRGRAEMGSASSDSRCRLRSRASSRPASSEIRATSRWRWSSLPCSSSRPRPTTFGPRTCAHSPRPGSRPLFSASSRPRPSRPRSRSRRERSSTASSRPAGARRRSPPSSFWRRSPRSSGGARRAVEKAAQLRHGNVAAATTQRDIGILAAREMIRARPLVGVGPGGFSNAFVPARIAAEERVSRRLVHLSDSAHFDNAHSEPLTLAAECGLPAAAAAVPLSRRIRGRTPRRATRPGAPSEPDHRRAPRRARRRARALPWRVPAETARRLGPARVLRGARVSARGSPAGSRTLPCPRACGVALGRRRDPPGRHGRPRRRRLVAGGGRGPAARGRRRARGRGSVREELLGAAKARLKRSVAIRPRDADSPAGARIGLMARARPRARPRALCALVRPRGARRKRPQPRPRRAQPLAAGSVRRPSSSAGPLDPAAAPRRAAGGCRPGPDPGRRRRGCGGHSRGGAGPPAFPPLR